jgi:hypothetical protein
MAKQHHNVKEPYKFRKVGGEWQRRRVAGGTWETLRSERVSAPPPPQDRRAHMTQPKTTIWSWK